MQLQVVIMAFGIASVITGVGVFLYGLTDKIKDKKTKSTWTNDPDFFIMGGLVFMSLGLLISFIRCLICHPQI